MNYERRKQKRIPLPNDVSIVPDERILRVAQFSNGIYWKGGVVFLFAVLLATQVLNLGIFLMVVAGIMLGVAYITKHYLLLILTNKRLLIRSGLIRMDTVQMAIDRIESVELERTIPGMILGYASVVVTGTGSRVMAVPFVDQPHVFRRLTDDVIYKVRNNGGSGQG
jgi:uncharacterized membrane protein YdbT with pleckstrin-like domain